MSQQTHTERADLNLMPWHIRAAEYDNLTADCILVAVMDGNEIQTISLHVAEKPIGE
jgi:hypothetical protein